MKIIDLLNKIANGEKVPKYISYYNKKESMSMIMFPCKDNIIYRLNEDAIDLGDEVEILEEEKKIPEKLDDFDLTTYSRDDEDLGLELNYTGVSNTFNDVYFKINEIIDYLKSKGDE